MKGVSAVMQSVDGFGFPVLSQSNTTNRTTFAPGRMESIVFASIECKWLPIPGIKTSQTKWKICKWMDQFGTVDFDTNWYSC